MKPKFNIGDKVTTGKITGDVRLIKWPTIIKNKRAALDPNGIPVYCVTGSFNFFQEQFLTKIQ